MISGKDNAAPLKAAAGTDTPVPGWVGFCGSAGGLGDGSAGCWAWAAVSTTACTGSDTKLVSVEAKRISKVYAVSFVKPENRLDICHSPSAKRYSAPSTGSSITVSSETDWTAGGFGAAGRAGIEQI